jgi:molybdate transport system substrate-binding protein
VKGTGSVVAMALVALIGACSAGAATSPVPAPSEALSVYAAASLKNAIVAVGRAYESAVAGATLTIATDSSSTLRTQIEQGAPADVFLSADQTNPQALVEAGLVDGDPVEFAGNVLTIIVPADNPAGLGSPVDLARPGTKVIAAGDEVPITKYAQQAVAKLALEPVYPADFADLYAANIVSKEENVNAIVAKIELGEGDAAIVYVTDAMAASDIDVIEIPASANVAATYAGVVLEHSPRREAAHAFLSWLAGPDGAAVLASFGFLPSS